VKKVYICSPYRGDEKNNARRAIKYAECAVRAGYMPLAPHIYFTRFLRDSVKDERELGLALGIAWLRECSEVWVFGLENPSEGMQAEIAEARAIGIPVRDGFVMLKE